MVLYKPICKGFLGTFKEMREVTPYLGLCDFGLSFINVVIVVVVLDFP